jgi:meiotic recombination protein SPO11
LLKIRQAKGYPDLSTREFLHTIHTSRPRLPILGLFDFDPDGIAIMRIYKYGSLKLGHEERCRVPGMRWIGMKGDDICLRPGYSRSSGQAIDHQSSSQALTQLEHQQRSSHMSSDVSSPLSARDRSMAASLLGAICGKPDASDEDLEQKRELQVMLMLGVKAEMQAVDHLGNIAGWLDERLRSALQ